MLQSKENRNAVKLTNIAESKAVLLMIWNDLSIYAKPFVSFCNRLWLCVAAASGHSEHCIGLNTEWAIGSKYLSLKRLNHWWKAVQSLLFNVQLHAHLKNWTLKVKLLHPLNYISCFNKICRICCVNRSLITYKFSKFGSYPSYLCWNTEFFLEDCFLLAHLVDYSNYLCRMSRSRGQAARF